MSSHPLHVNQLEDGELNQLFEDRSLKGRDGYARLHCARAASYRFTRRGDILNKMENTRFDLHLRYAAVGCFINIPNLFFKIIVS